MGIEKSGSSRVRIPLRCLESSQIKYVGSSILRMCVQGPASSQFVSNQKSGSSMVRKHTRCPGSSGRRKTGSSSIRICLQWPVLSEYVYNSEALKTGSSVTRQCARNVRSSHLVSVVFKTGTSITRSCVCNVRLCRRGSHRSGSSIVSTRVRCPELESLVSKEKTGSSVI